MTARGAQSVITRPEDRSREILISPETDGELRRLITDHLVPTLEPMSPRLAYKATDCKPFLTSSAQNSLAVDYRRATSRGWALPPETPRKAEWIRLATNRWAEEFGRWPVVGDWRSSAAALTHEQRQAVARLDAARREREEAVARLDSRIVDLEVKLEQVSEDARKGALRLLTEKGNELAEAAEAALVGLGFLVENTDRMIPDGQAKREDLQIRLADTDPPRLVEVKGYDNGVKATDMRKPARHEARARAEKVDPQGIIWLVNHDRQQDPAKRPEALPGEDAAINEDASAYRLLVVDTVDLFRVCRAAEAGEIVADVVRSSLLEQTGRWDPPA